MIQTCLGSFYLSIFIWVVLSKFLFFLALEKSEGEVKTLLIVAVAFDLIMFLTLPLLLVMTKGVCLGVTG